MKGNWRAPVDCPYKLLLVRRAFQDGARWKHGTVGHAIYVDPAQDLAGVHFSNNGNVPFNGGATCPNSLTARPSSLPRIVAAMGRGYRIEMGR